MATFFARRIELDWSYTASQIEVKATPRSQSNTICVPQWVKITGIKLKIRDGWQEIESTFKIKRRK